LLLAHRAPSIRLLRPRSQRKERLCSLPCASLAPLAEAGACEPLTSSLARRRRTCLLARSSSTAARQPGSGWRAPIPTLAASRADLVTISVDGSLRQWQRARWEHDDHVSSRASR
jgi:hypothetical protein